MVGQGHIVVGFVKLTSHFSRVILYQMSDANPKEKDPKDYELAVLVKEEGDLTAVATLIREHAGVTADFRARKVALAYPIRKEKEAIFAYANIRAMGETVKTLEHDLNLRNDVLRSLIVLLPRPEKPRETAMPVAPVPHKRTTPDRSAPIMTASRQNAGPISNEALEKKIEEILK
jgi:ribosomal protein S6